MELATTSSGAYWDKCRASVLFYAQLATCFCYTATSERSNDLRGNLLPNEHPRIHFMLRTRGVFTVEAHQCPRLAGEHHFTNADDVYVHPIHFEPNALLSVSDFGRLTPYSRRQPVPLSRPPVYLSLVEARRTLPRSAFPPRDAHICLVCSGQSNVERQQLSWRLSRSKRTPTISSGAMKAAPSSIDGSGSGTGIT